MLWINKNIYKELPSEAKSEIFALRGKIWRLCSERKKLQSTEEPRGAGACIWEDGDEFKPPRGPS